MRFQTYSISARADRGRDVRGTQEVTDPTSGLYEAPPRKGMPYRSEALLVSVLLFRLALSGVFTLPVLAGHS